MNQTADSQKYKNPGLHPDRLKYGYFKIPGQMLINRFSPSAVKLKDGRVLVFGGQVDTNSADFRLGEIRPTQAEIYDPHTEKYSLTGAIKIIRVDYGTTLLKDGRVAIIGGMAASKALSDIEIYDPTTGKFSIVAQLKKAREMPAVITLLDGRVLILGGNMHETSAEVFDPNTNEATLLESQMSVGRRLARMILLDDGKVLIAIGHKLSPLVDIFDPTTSSFSSASRMPDRRVTPMMTKLSNGEVMLAGGNLANPDHPDSGTRTSTVLLYNPSKNQWRYARNNINDPRTSGYSLLLDSGKVFLGGDGERFSFRDPKWTPVQIFDPKTETFESIGFMPFYHAHPKILKLDNGQILILGRTSPQNKSINTRLYIP